MTIKKAYNPNLAKAFLRLFRTTNSEAMEKGRWRSSSISHHLDLWLTHHVFETKYPPVDDGCDDAQDDKNDGQRCSVTELVVGEIAAEGKVVSIKDFLRENKIVKLDLFMGGDEDE